MTREQLHKDSCATQFKTHIPEQGSNFSIDNTSQVSDNISCASFN